MPRLTESPSQSGLTRKEKTPHPFGAHNTRMSVCAHTTVASTKGRLQNFSKPLKNGLPFWSASLLGFFLGFALCNFSNLPIKQPEALIEAREQAESGGAGGGGSVLIYCANAVRCEGTITVEDSK